MAQAARRRTAAQRARKNEDEEPVIIQDEEEQEKEIQALRGKNEQDDKSAWRILDGFILVAVLLKVIEAYQLYDRGGSVPVVLITFVQATLTCSAFSPHTVGNATRTLSLNNDAIYNTRICCTLALALMTAIVLVIQNSDGRLGLFDAIRAMMPLVLHGASWMQLRSESSMERDLKSLEKAKYRMKGA